MMHALIIATIISWLAIFALGVMLYALSRQIGVLHERIKPVGALSLGKALHVGETAPVFTQTSLTGGMVHIGGDAIDGKAMLLVFISATCPVCKTLLPVLKSISAHESDWLKLVFASDGDEREHVDVIKMHALKDYPYLLSMEIGMAYQVSKLPYAVLINPQGFIAAHGLINNREHIESLFEAYATNRQNKQAGGAHVGQLAG